MWITSRRRSQAVCSSFAVTFCVLLLHSFTIVWTQQSCDNEGEVRLLYGGTVNSDRGRLEVCAEGVWGTVCTDRFDANDAKVVCRQLGIPEEFLSEVVTNIYFGGGGSNTPIHLDDVACTGTEQQLFNCSRRLGIGTHDCTLSDHDGATDHSKDVGIICRQSQDCREGDVRLVDGANTSAIAGRVEYCVGGLWGTVCDHNTWSDGDAAVVCRQLGHSTPSPTKLESVPPLSGAALRTPIVLSGLECSSTESRLSDCHSAPEIEGCSHSTDVGANCTDPRDCRGNEIRIFRIDGNQTENNNEGRVDVCTGGQWGLLCFSNAWDVNFATVLCRQLGVNPSTGVNATVAVRRVTFNDYDLNAPVVYTGIDCDGTEGSIFECNPSLGIPFCFDGAVGVTCAVPDTVLVDNTSVTLLPEDSTTVTEKNTSDSNSMGLVVGILVASVHIALC